MYAVFIGAKYLGKGAAKFLEADVPPLMAIPGTQYLIIDYVLKQVSSRHRLPCISVGGGQVTRATTHHSAFGGE